MPKTFILTCEHAGNEIPAEYEHLFHGKKEVLYTHKAIDFGALRLAKHLSAELELPLCYTPVSRLLVEANRSLDNKELFSGYSQVLTEQEKQLLLGRHYFPHRKQVESKIEKETAAGNQVYHLAIHTFTPVLNGEVREADIGILYDPEREPEKNFAQRLKEQLTAQNPERRVLFNSPYPGTDDGLPTYLRTRFDTAHYVGLELEVNQKFFLNGPPEVWQKLVDEITAALKALDRWEGEF